MSSTDQELSELVGDLTGVVEELQTQLESARGRPRPPTPRRLAEFTSEVTIPAIILVLETNVRALRLLQRSLRLAEGRESEDGQSVARQRATDLGRATLARLDDALTDLGTTLEDTPTDGETRDLLEDVRDLQAEIDARLDTRQEMPTDESAGASVAIDVDSELQSIKDDIDDASSHEGT